MGEQAVTKGPDESMYLHSIGNLGTWLPYTIHCFAYIKWNRSFCAHGTEGK